MNFRTFLVFLLLASVAQAADEGIRPVGADGKPLNLDFETGTLQDWTAEGQAFIGQPVKGDTVAARRGDMKSQHQGQFWVGTYEVKQDQPQGTLTSAAFKVTYPWATFLVGGGSHPTTSVELVRKDGGEVIARVAGIDDETLKRVAVDLGAHQGKEIFVRLLDKHSGGWGHINFDDFLFHAQKPNVAQRAAPAVPLQTDVLKNAGLTPEKAAAAMTVPEGFEVKLFAGEPDVHQPIAMCLDDRGRVWVAEAYAYPRRVDPKEAKDRILIFEDADGDGKFDKQTVFFEGLNLVSGLEVGFGGVWVGAAPELLFIPMKDDKPTSPPQVLLDGWHYEDSHETLNSFLWGPDGWLYGCHGVFTHSVVGKPGTPAQDRTKINAGIWRYHPTRHVFEVFAHGTSNPWGFDFNDRGQAFCEACVIPHCFHIIQGARYLRQAGQHFNPYTYADIDTIADHRHYLGAYPHGGNEKSDAAGGGHAHCGTMIYLGGSWPGEYRDQMFMGNIHGRRLNVDILNPKGSGYVASHGKDFLLANDAWARFINFRYGPDSNVYIIDWYDKQACHRAEPEIWDRTNGRIFKVSFRGSKPVQVDLARKTDQELVDLQLHANDWYVRHSRRLLQERAAAKNLDAATHDALAKIAFEHKDETRRLRGLWALHVVDGLTPERVTKALADASPYVRGWTIQLALERGKADEALLKKLAELAEKDPSPIVRLYVASGLLRLPLDKRWAALEALAGHSEDATDHNLPLMYWYTAEPLAGADANRALDLAAKAKVPQLLPFMVRRIGSAGTPEGLSLLVDRLATTDDAKIQTVYLRGLNEALKGRRSVAMPKAWSAAFDKLLRSTNTEVRIQATALAVTFGDARAMDRMRIVLADAKADTEARRGALVSLLGANDKQLAPVLQKLMSDEALRGPALRGLASYDDPETPKAILAVYASLPLPEKRDALNTLASRVAYGKALLDAVAAKKVASAEVPAEVVRQLRGLGDKDLVARIAEAWGTLRDTPEERKKVMAEWKGRLTKPYSGKPDLSLGRAVFNKTCAQCHTLFAVGGKIGPDITGSNRANLDYLMENIFDPGAVIPNEYKVTQFELTNGRVVTGILKGETPAAVTVLTANETLTIPVGDIDERKPSPNSMMPDDLLKPHTEAEIRALIAYLQNPGQVPALATAENVKDFFNGKDLTGWDGDPKLWSVENGEIVGKSPGIKKNEFLRSHLVAEDFKLTLKVKLTPNTENSGIQFRSEPHTDGEMKGPQADVGAGWWGKLYEENVRGLLWDKSAEKAVKVNDWNEYVIVAEGTKVKTYINGQLSVDLDDPMLSRRGIFALQIHSGGAMEVRFKDLKLELMPPR